MFRRSPDFWSGLALVALGVYIVTATRGWEYLSAEGPGPAFFPRWYGVAMIVLAAAMVLGSASAPAIDWRGARRALGTWVAIALCVVIIRFAGFALGFAVLTYFIVALMYRRAPLHAALVALAMVAAFYLIFPLALGVPLP
jgi:putative tricarboxylic transport membrane protein